MGEILWRCCESVDEPTPPRPGEDPYLSSSGVVANPFSPQGGSGSGGSGGVTSLGSTIDFWDDLPHPQAPAMRYMDPIELANKDAKQKQAPVASPNVGRDERKTVNGVAVTVRADRSGVSGVKVAQTGINYDAGLLPQATTTEDNKILKITGPMPVITATLGTEYGPGADPNGKSAYGRGTTDADKTAGNISLAFHESCHRQDHLNFLKQNTLPKFAGKVGMTAQEWNDAYTKYVEDVNDFKLRSDANTLALTDEVGSPKLSDYRRGP